MNTVWIEGKSTFHGLPGPIHVVVQIGFNGFDVCEGGDYNFGFARSVGTTVAVWFPAQA